MGKEVTETVNKVNAKLALFKALKEAGFRTELDSSSVPTVICKNADDMEETIKAVKKIVKDTEYNSSYGVRIMRRGDINLVEDDTVSDSEDMAATEDVSTIDFDNDGEDIQQAV